MSSLNTVPLVSIVMPAYNAAATIAHSIHSVLAQTLNDWELLIIDDGSTDETLNIVAQLNSSGRIRIFHTGGRHGSARARNIGIASARGRYIAFLDSDDLWLPEKLQKQIQFMEGTGSHFSFTAYRRMTFEGDIGTGVLHIPNKVSYKDLLKTNHIGCLTAMYDRKYFGEVVIPTLEKAESYRLWKYLLKGQVVHEDYGLWLKLLKQPPDGQEEKVWAWGLDEPLALYRRGHSSRSSNKIAAATSQWLIYRRLENLSLAASLYYFIHYATKGLRKYLIK
jgi:teichuronic acid biosynthesis glycosyltransferase TuaG